MLLYSLLFLKMETVVTAMVGKLNYFVSNKEKMIFGFEFDIVIFNISANILMNTTV